MERNAHRTDEAIRQALSALVQERGVDLAHLSRAIGKNHAYLQQYLKRGKPRYLSDIVRRDICIELGLEPDCLDPPDFRHGQRHHIGGGMASIAEVDVRASAGAGRVVDREDEVARWGFPEPWIRVTLNAQPTELKIITIEGLSMVSDPPKPDDLRPGDKVIVNIADTIPTPPGNFVVFDGLGLVAKFVEYIPHSEPPTVRILSNNPRIPPYERCLDEAYIRGRIVSRWQRM